MNCLFLILLLSVELTSTDSKPLSCVYTVGHDWSSSCEEGGLSGVSDYLGHIPTQCCAAQYMYNDCYFEDDDSCLRHLEFNCYQIDTDYIQDYYPSIVADIEKTVDPYDDIDTIKIVCKGNGVTYYDPNYRYQNNDQNDGSSSSYFYILSKKLSLLFLLL